MFKKKKGKQKVPASAATWTGTDSHRSSLFVDASIVPLSKMLKCSLGMLLMHIFRKIHPVKTKQAEIISS